MASLRFPSNAGDMLMNKISLLLILTACGLLAGCPPVYKVNLRNETSTDIVIFYHYNDSELLRIPANGEGREHWSHYCFAISDNGVIYYFDGTDLPSSVYETHMFSTSLNAIYNHGKLRYLDSNGQVVASVDGASECK